MEDLKKGRSEQNLDRRMKIYLAPKALIVDEFDIWPGDRESATAFCTLVSAMYERGEHSKQSILPCKDLVTRRSRRSYAHKVMAAESLP